MDKKAWDAQHHAFEQAFGALRACPAPVIAAVHGAAMGGGLELALACDFIYAADNARFALPEVTLGIMPGLGGAEALSRAVGSARAKELLFTGKPFSAEEAYRMGMVNRLLPQETVLEETLATARTIAANAPLAVKAIKKTLRRPQRSELAEYAKLLTTKDRHEGIKAFHEKRKPVFVGK